MPDRQLTPEESYNVLAAQVHAPEFFNKLASVYNIAPQTQDEARELLLLAGELRNAHEQANVKQAEVRGNYYAQARQHLSAHLNNNGFTPFAVDDGVTKKAAEATQNPLVKEAALIFSNYLAQANQG